MTKLTTHALDVYSGKPGAGIKVELYYLKNNEREKTTERERSIGIFLRQNASQVYRAGPQTV